jgi:hypothetical protein
LFFVSRFGREPALTYISGFKREKIGNRETNEQRVNAMMELWFSMCRMQYRGDKPALFWVGGVPEAGEASGWQVVTILSPLPG